MGNDAQAQEGQHRQAERERCWRHVQEVPWEEQTEAPESASDSELKGPCSRSGTGVSVSRHAVWSAGLSFSCPDPSPCLHSPQVGLCLLLLHPLFPDCVALFQRVPSLLHPVLHSGSFPALFLLLLLLRSALVAAAGDRRQLCLQSWPVAVQCGFDLFTATTQSSVVSHSRPV